MKQAIPSDEIRFHPLSFQDEAGRLFQWRGALYRAITAGSAPFLTSLLAGPVGPALVDAGLLIESALTPYTLDGFELVLSHRLLPFASYPFEWCTAMFKAACLQILDLSIALARHDLMLKDAHPWNVIFDGCRPVWIDLTSILPANGARTWPAEAEFHDNCLHPLLLMAQGRDKLARAIIADSEIVQRADLEQFGGSRSLLIDVTTALLSHVPERKRKMIRQTLRPLRSVRNRKVDSKSIPLLQRLEQIKQEVAEISVPFEKTRASAANFEPNDNWNAKERALHQILRLAKPRTVLDIAPGAGWSSELAAHLGAKVVGFETDPEAVGRLFASARARKLSLLPLVMDFTRPTAARGLANHSHIAATERYRCEMVLMLGFLHDLVFRYRRLGLDAISDGLALFSERWLVLEFIPGDDPEVGALQSEWFAGYTLENLQRALGRHFSRIEVMPSYPPSRVLLFCER